MSLHIITEGPDYWPWGVGASSRGWHIVNQMSGIKRLVGPARVRAPGTLAQAKQQAKVRNASYRARMLREIGDELQAAAALVPDSDMAAAAALRGGELT